MRIPSGVTDQYIYFVAVDSVDYVTRKTGFGATGWTVYRSRNTTTATVFTTPTIAEVDTTNMPGVYVLLLDEDMTIGSGNDSEEMAFHITHANMAPVTRTIELYREKITQGETLTVTSSALGANTITATSIATDAIDADALAANAVDEILDDVVAGTTTLRQALRGFIAALIGKADGLGTTTVHYRDIADTKNVITATVDADGNRSAITLDLT